ncbi:hypothetical protein KBD45_01770 [Candidatus Dojkabacteria bacterium]|nr:hypothetical protein [Candidatus Dojkabacteria bacterium]
MPDTQVTQQNTKAQDILSGILQGKMTDVQSITPWIVKSSKLNNKILRIFAKSLKDDEGWDDTKILEMILFFDEAAERGNITNDFLGKMKSNPEFLNEIINYISKAK